MKKLKLLVDVLRAVRLVMSYVVDDGGRAVTRRDAPRLGD
jgi:hypothetical protein